MKDIMDFLSAALPWICMGLLLAIFFARSARKKKEDKKKENYGTESYLAMLDTQMDKIIDTILSAKHNVLFFCGAGKDRTGVVSAILLKIFGYDDKTIIDDYMKTKENLHDYLKSYVEEHPEVDINTVMPNESNIKAVLKVI